MTSGTDVPNQMIIQRILGGSVQCHHLWAYRVPEVLGGVAGANVFSIVDHTAIDKTPALIAEATERCVTR